MLDIADLHALRQYLDLTGHIPASENIELIPLHGGVSARTILVRRGGIDTWVIKQALSKLAVKSDWFSDPARIHREAEALRFLPQVAPAKYFTPLIFEDFDNHLIAMQAVPRPHENLKTVFLDPTSNIARIVGASAKLGFILGKIHTAEPIASFADQSFFESLRLEPYYLYTAQQIPEAKNFLEELVASTRARKLAIVHGDFSPKNVLDVNGELVLLDHEVIHIGDPAFDVGFFLTHLLAKSIHVDGQRHAFHVAAAAFVQTYSVYGAIDSRAVQHTIGCLLARVAGRSQLEYLTPTERDIQQRAALSLMRNSPSDLHHLIEEFHRCTKSST